MSFIESQFIYILMGVLCGVVLVFVIIVLLVWRRQRRKMQLAEHTTLTFANPTYHRSSSEHISIERRVKPWRFFRYDKNEVHFIIKDIVFWGIHLRGKCHCQEEHSFEIKYTSHRIHIIATFFRQFL